VGDADPNCAYCKGSGTRTTWDIDPETDQYDWIEIACECMSD
jgi:hypothetical protein